MHVNIGQVYNTHHDMHPLIKLATWQLYQQVEQVIEHIKSNIK
jgi:hypothetical protein